MTESKDMLVIEVIAGIGKIERGIGTMAMEYWTDKDAAPLNKGVALLRGLDLENARLRAELDEALGVAKSIVSIWYGHGTDENNWTEDQAGVTNELYKEGVIDKARAFLSKHSKEGREVTDNKG